MLLTKKDMSVNANCSILERTAYGGGNVGNSLAYYGITTFFLFYCTNYMDLNAGIIGTIFLITKFLDGVSDFIMGSILDRTKAKMGKGRVWILRGSIPYAIATILLFCIPTGPSDTVKYIYVFVMYNMVNTVFYTCVTLSYNTLNCLMTKNQYERGILGIFNMFGTVAGQTIANTFTMTLVEKFGGTKAAWTAAFAVYAIAGMLLQWICVKGVTERVTIANRRNSSDSLSQSTEKKIPVFESVKAILHNKYWIMFTATYILVMTWSGLYYSSVIYYATSVLGDADYQVLLNNPVTIGQLILLLLSFAIIKKYGKAKTFNIGVIIMLIAMVGQMIVGDTLFAQIVLNIVKGCGLGIASSVVAGMCSDTVEYGEWKTGIRTEGLAFGAMSMASKIGNGIGAAAMGWLLVWGGYDGNASIQSASTIMAIKSAYLYIPFVLCALMVVIMYFYKLDKEYPRIARELEERHSVFMEK